jgi:hypothetical protein
MERVIATFDLEMTYLMKAFILSYPVDLVL